MTRTQKAARHQAGTASRSDERGLLPGEVPEEAADLAAAVRTRIQPADVIEEIWLDDFVYLALEVQRLRRLKRWMVEAARPEGLEQLLADVVDNDEASQLTTLWCAGDKAAVREITNALRPVGLGFDHINAKAFELRIAEIEKVDLMLVRAEARRDNALHAIAQHRDGFAAQLSAATEVAAAAVPALAPPPEAGRDG